MCVISALRKARFSMIGPMCSCGISRKSFSMGSSSLPAASFFHSTSGRETSTSQPSRRICSTRMAICISPRPLTAKIFGSSVCSMRKATFVRVSLTSRSQMWRAVTSLPSLPPSGPSLTANSIRIVGGSMGLCGRAGRSGLSTMLSPMKTSSKPVTPTMSPACASGTSMRLSPSKW